MNVCSVIVLSAVMLAAGCTDRKPVGPAISTKTEPLFSCRYVISTTPVPDALHRYTDFEIRIREKASSTLRIFPPASVRPDSHGGLRVDFEIKIPEPMIGEEYVVIKSHKLDGRESVGSPETTVFKTTSIP